MAFDRSKFAMSSSHQNGNIPRTWVYTTPDAQSVVRVVDYFLEVIGEVNAGDVIIAMTSTGTAQTGYIMTVLSNDGTAIDVSDGLAIGVTDTD